MRGPVVHPDPSARWGRWIRRGGVLRATMSACHPFVAVVAVRDFIGHAWFMGWFMHRSPRAGWPAWRGQPVVPLMFRRIASASYCGPSESVHVRTAHFLLSLPSVSGASIDVMAARIVEVTLPRAVRGP